MRTKILLTAGLVLILTSFALGWTLVVKGGRIITMADGIIENGVIIIENNLIGEVGSDLEIPAGAAVLDATGKTITPGLFDAYTHIGLVEISEEKSTVDVDEQSEPFTPEARTIDAFNSQSELIPVTRIEGVTTILSAPGTKNVIAGQSAVLELAGETVNEMTVKAPAALHINFGEDPTSAWREKNKIDTRMGLVAKLRQKFIDAQDYAAKWTKFEAEMDAYTIT
jgi:imidazolonepropionase-like amidohydrolase